MVHGIVIMFRNLSDIIIIEDFWELFVLVGEGGGGRVFYQCWCIGVPLRV